MNTITQSIPEFNLTDITITQFLGNFFIGLEEQFKPEFVQQIKRVVEEFDRYLLNNNIAGAQSIRNAFVLGAQIEQRPSSQSGPFSDRLLSTMNQAIEEYFSFQEKPIPTNEKFGAKARIVRYNTLINDVIKP